MNAIHAAVRGTVPESGAAYQATDPALLLWVHATLVDTALRVYDRYVAPLTAEEQQATTPRRARSRSAWAFPRRACRTRWWSCAGEMARMMADGTVHVDATARAWRPTFATRSASRRGGLGHGAPHLGLGAAASQSGADTAFPGPRRARRACSAWLPCRGAWYRSCRPSCAACHRPAAPSRGSPAWPLGDGDPAPSVSCRRSA